MSDSSLAAETAVPYASVDKAGLYLEELVKDYPKELESSKAEALQLAKNARGEIAGSTFATVEIKGRQLTMIAESVNVKFVAQINTELWATGKIVGMYYFDHIQHIQNPYNIQITFTPQNTLITWSKTGQSIFRFVRISFFVTTINNDNLVN
ncbi:hypothetical protein BOTBODRAFT_177712 [Botryobasidium botryosum FD-172 SS1]|uniref:Uncharacterized protein n=1 Tax=Botryobasidium botryosum (strain FD-172 SS1) TaxID=930990 RepID=A0A067MGK4_BOTB1|nr:hypothetical protein BOTBODRAFT_177712 [Botryobasidium botryosum FD-172 SS1]